jgi:excisionase family DNA binding protein
MAPKVRIREVSRQFGVSVHTLYKKVARREIPFERLGPNGPLLFDLDAIEGVAQANGCSPEEAKRRVGTDRRPDHR